MNFTELLTEAPKKTIGDPAIPKKLKPGSKHSIPDSFLDKLKVKLDKIVAANPDKEEEAKKLFDQIKAKHLEMVALKKAKAALVKKEKELTKAQAELVTKHKKASVTPTYTNDLEGLTKKYQALVERDCKEYLKAVKASKKILYRGMNGNYPIFIGKPWDERSPKDTNNKAHEFFNDALLAGGFKATRGNSIFCSSSRDFAEGYGDLYAIFPKDGFSFTWTDKYEDFYSGPLGDGYDIVSYFKSGPKDKTLDMWIDKVGKIGRQIRSIISNLSDEYSYAEETIAYNDDDISAAELIKLQKIEKALRPYSGFMSNYDDYWDDERYDPFSELADDYDNDSDDWDYNYDSEEDFQKEFWADFNKEAKYALKHLIKISSAVKMLPVKAGIKKLPMLVTELQKTLAKQPKVEIPKMSKSVALAGLNKLHFHKDNLVGALKSGNEVYVTGEYYAFKVRSEYDDDDDDDSYYSGFDSKWKLRHHQKKFDAYSKSIGAVAGPAAKKAKKAKPHLTNNSLKSKVGKQLIAIYTAKPKAAKKAKKK